MKSKIIQTKKIECENNNKINFTTFTFNDSKSFVLSVGCYENLEPEFKTGVEVIFTHKLPSGNVQNFMTIIWPTDYVDHSTTLLGAILKNLNGKRIRLFEDIFRFPYFDYADVCFPNKVVKLRNSN